MRSLKSQQRMLGIICHLRKNNFFFLFFSWKSKHYSLDSLWLVVRFREAHYKTQACNVAALSS